MERPRLEKLLLGILKTKGPQSTLMIWTIFKNSKAKILQSDSRPSEDEMIATLAGLEADNKIIKKQGIWSIKTPMVQIEGQVQHLPSVGKTPIEPMKTLDHPIAIEIGEPIEDENGPLVQHPPTVEKSYMEVTCPKCGQSSKYRPWAKSPSITRERRKCPKCNKKSEFKLWTILDQKVQHLPSVGKTPIEPMKTLDHPIAIEIGEPIEDENGPLVQHPRSVDKTYSDLSKVQNDILEMINQGYFAAVIGKKLGLPAYSMTRYIKKLIFYGYLIEVKGSYPKIYKINTNESKPKPELKPEPTQWPMETDVHRNRFITPILKFGDLSGAHTSQVGGWTQYSFNPKFLAGVPHDWKFQITTKNIICNYRWEVTGVKNVKAATDDLKQQIPWEYFEKRGFLFDKPATKLVQKQHCNFKKLSRLGTKITGTIHLKDEEVEVNQSEDEEGDYEVDADHAQSIMDVPQKLDDLQEATAILSQQMNTNQATANEATDSLKNQMLTLSQKIDQIYQSQIVVVKAMSGILGLQTQPPSAPPPTTHEHSSNNINYI